MVVARWPWASGVHCRASLCSSVGGGCQRSVVQAGACPQVARGASLAKRSVTRGVPEGLFACKAVGRAGRALLTCRAVSRRALGSPGGGCARDSTSIPGPFPAFFAPLPGGFSSCPSPTFPSASPPSTGRTVPCGRLAGPTGWVSAELSRCVAAL